MRVALPDRVRPALPWAALGARVVLAGVLAYAAITKIGDPQATVRAVRAYELLPNSVEVPLGYALPAFELVLAALLLAGVALRLAGTLSAVLMLAFVAGVSSAWARGLEIDCGCFGGGGPTDDPQYTLELFRDGGLLLLAVLVAVVPRSRYAVDPPPVPRPPETMSPEGNRAEQRRHRADQAHYENRVRARTSRVRWYTGGAAVLLALSALIGVSAGYASEPKQGAPEPKGVTAKGGLLVGSADAPHRLVIYEDPQCPVCGNFEKASGEVLRRAVTDGVVRVEYRLRVFLGPESVRAVAALGAAADEEAFEALREQVFTHQPPEQTGGFTVEDLLALGRAAGITASSFEQAVRDQRYAAWARRTDDQASRDGNVGTPELRLDGRPVPLGVAFDPARFDALLRA